MECETTKSDGYERVRSRLDEVHAAQDDETSDEGELHEAQGFDHNTWDNDEFYKSKAPTMSLGTWTTKTMGHSLFKRGLATGTSNTLLPPPTPSAFRGDGSAHPGSRTTAHWGNPTSGGIQFSMFLLTGSAPFYHLEAAIPCRYLIRPHATISTTHTRKISGWKLTFLVPETCAAYHVGELGFACSCP
jgi:hypothetical protein